MHESFYQGFSGQRQSDPPQTLTRRIYSKSPERSNGNQWKTCFLGPTLVLDGLFFFFLRERDGGGRDQRYPAVLQSACRMFS